MLTLSTTGRTIALAIAALAVTGTALDLLLAWGGLFRTSDAASHVVLVPLASAVLLYRRRDVVFSSVEWAPAAGGALVAGGGALLVLGRQWTTPTDGAFAASLAGIVTVCIGAFVVCFGVKAARAGLFALLFLFCVIPIPAVIMDGATNALKVASTEAVAVLFSTTGTTYHREGFTFTLSQFSIQVADECSGIRSSLALMFTALVIGQLSLRRVWARVLLVLVVIPITVFKNAVRIVSLTLLATHVHPSFLVGRLHNEGGIVFFLLALALMGPMLAILRRTDAASRLTQPNVATSR